MNRFAFLLISGTFLFTASCSEPDQICDCIKASDAVNKKSAEVLQKDPTTADETELKKLRAEKKKKCEQFEDMSGPEMLERKESCAE